MTPPIVKRFLISLEQNKLIGFIAFVFVFMGSGVVAMWPTPEPEPPTYKVIGALSFRTPPPIFTSTGEQLQQAGRQVNEQILLADRVLEQVSEKVQVPPRELINNIKLKFPKEKEKEFIILEYKHPQDPREARSVLSAFMPIMVEHSRWLNTYQLRIKIEALEKRLAQVKEELTEAEKEYYKYITKEGSSLLAVQDGSLFSGITGSQQQQRDIQLALDEVEGQISSLVKQLGMTADQAYTSSSLSADPIIANLRAQILQNEMQLELLSRDLRPEHPTMVELLAQKNANEKLLQERAAEIIGTDGILTPLPSQIRKESNLDPARQELAYKLVALEAQREGLQKQLEFVQKTELELRRQYEQFPDKQLEQARLVQKVEDKRTRYQNILAVLVDAQSAEAETQSSLEIATVPYIERIKPKIPKPKNPVLIMGVGAGVGLLFGGGVIFLMAILDSRLHTSQELRTAFSDRDVLLLGELPLIFESDSMEQNTPILLDADSLYLPYYERFRSNLRRLGPDSSGVVLITSITHEEGKTVSAYNLGIASAHAGRRTLLIEADLRSPSHAKYLDLALDQEASIEPLRYYGARTDSIRLVPQIENLYILPSPGPQRRAAAIIESSELKRLLEDARQRFDLVIIDTPSLSSCNDALLLEPFTDGIIIVTCPGLTPGNLLGESIDQFTEAELPILGGIINGVEHLMPIRERSQHLINEGFEGPDDRLEGDTENEAEKVATRTSSEKMRR
ncbi:MAG: AAA family ATPase [Moorea sp. SIO2B7]|nr:AAA family ATPase [Moorena sp. SIO2B7]